MPVDMYRCEVDLKNAEGFDDRTFEDRLVEARNKVEADLAEFGAPVSLEGATLVVGLPKLLTGDQRVAASFRTGIVLGAKGLEYVGGRNQFTD